MTIEYFDRLLQGNNAIKVDDTHYIFNDYELYSTDSKLSRNYDSLEELLEDNPKIKEIIEKTYEFYLPLEGGRGQGSGAMGGGFTSAGGRKGNNREVLLNAELNLGTSGGNSVQMVLDRFKEKYGDATREYAIAVDRDGFVHQHIKGGKTSVGIEGNAGETIIHNHPSGGNFSKADLQNVASTKAKGIVATSSNTPKKATYSFEKTDKFQSKEFLKAVDKAKWPTKYDYDKGASWWLKKNQSVYGYKYTESHK